MPYPFTNHRCCFQSNLWGDLFRIRTSARSGFPASIPTLEEAMWNVRPAFRRCHSSGGLEIDGPRADLVLGRLPPPFDFLPKYVEPDAKGPLHESLKKAWWLLELPCRFECRSKPCTKEHDEQIVEIFYECGGGHTQTLRFWSTETPLPATYCVKCRAGFWSRSEPTAMAGTPRSFVRRASGTVTRKSFLSEVCAVSPLAHLWC